MWAIDARFYEVGQVGDVTIQSIRKIGPFVAEHIISVLEVGVARNEHAAKFTDKLPTPCRPYLDAILVPKIDHV